MQKINLLGMNLTDYSLREAIGITDRFLGSGSLNTILFISAKMLVGAGISGEQKAWLEAGDLIIWSDAEIIKYAGISDRERIREVENEEYVKELLKRLGRGKKPICLLAESEEDVETLKEDLLYLRQDLKIVGSEVIGSGKEDPEDAANRINSLTPSVIISRMEFEYQEKLMEEIKRFLNADVWIALNQQMILNGQGFFLKKLWNKWYHHLFQKQLETWHDQQDQSEKQEPEE